MDYPKHWYGLRRWRRKAQRQLTVHPLCVKCLDHGLVNRATVADHIIKHKGNEDLFWHGALQSLCTTCHNSTKHGEELRGYAITVDAQGWPTDPRHPANSGKIATRSR